LLPSGIPSGRVFGLDLQTLISIGVHLCNLALLAFIMSRLLYVPVREFLYKRTARIREQMARAKEEKDKAEDLQHQYEEKIRHIEQERDALLAEAQKLVARDREQLLAEARIDADVIRAAAAEEIELEKSRVQEEMKQVIFDVSSTMAEKLIAVSLDESAHERLFDQTIAELEDISWWK